MRTHFEEQLERLNHELIDMGALCEDAISACTKELLDPDGTELGAARIYERDIDQKEREIETLCLRLLLQQQPVARDLRLISAAMKMISDMERIGDQASDIEEITQYIHNNTDLKSRLHINEMAKATIEMVTDAVDSFVKKDIALARSVMDYDDIVDDLFRNIKEELIRMISDGDNRGELFLDLLMIAKYFERIGDHAVNIAEWVEYSITGSHPKLGGI
ncbi:phosphate transport system protein [Sporobacter termitidis DSM 10068]|uniref:Phosphate-specific transport system accessory protein PhoU n=1 Tax=Sporobacter termitidis DSM 10068 TaxID=1123282 RepID=A0A1M5X2X6_9FIRM|nr:phosphate signaling complex protein PhoU [Sporobacter termitidis]SHH94141.1 phosphate transport system protein [Sporobacter termitidis DSM 10068]